MSGLVSGRRLVRLSLSDLRLRGRLVGEILRVGAPSLLSNVQANLTVVLLTGLVGPFGTTALAGYGMGARLEYLQIPLVFGLGSALVTMVGTNIGAGQRPEPNGLPGPCRDGGGPHGSDRARRRAGPACLARPLQLKGNP
jgi:Na+-driven multidrug efflux pump